LSEHGRERTCVTENVIWEALRRESDLVRQHLGFGATTIGTVRFERPGLYAQAFFALSIGFERAAKLALTLDAAASENGQFLGSSDLRQYGHNLIDLFDAVEQVAIARNLDGVQRPRTGIHETILRVLSDFASNVTRYYNLEILQPASSGARDPIALWYEEVIKPILRAHDTEKRRERTERSVEAIAAPSSAVFVVATTETGGSIADLSGLMRRSAEANAVGPWQRMYVLQLARFVTRVISELGGLLQRTRPDIPFLEEFFYPFQLDDGDFRRLKVWPPTELATLSERSASESAMSRRTIAFTRPEAPVRTTALRRTHAPAPIERTHAPGRMRKRRARRQLPGRRCWIHAIAQARRLARSG
jgi:hypothetical protein